MSCAGTASNRLCPGGNARLPKAGGSQRWGVEYGASRTVMQGTREFAWGPRVGFDRLPCPGVSGAL